MRELERRYPGELVIIGVHAGKFPHERHTANILRASYREDALHPIVNDRHFRVWRDYAVRAWPTLTLIDAAGNVAAQQAGELTADQLEPLIERLIADAGDALERAPRHWPVDPLPEPPATLAFPGKVIADEAGRIVVADTRHHRVLVLESGDDARHARLRHVIGHGEAGFADGSFAVARLRAPHGLAWLDEQRLLIADTENHAIRLADLQAGALTTLVGTGEQGRHFNMPGRGREVALSSPWDLLHHDGMVYAAMAGFHQIWSVDPETGEARPWAGSGAEAITDGPLRTATLAQPSGLASDGQRLFFADSESSAIRAADFVEREVRTLVGTGLFDFGDRDGAGDDVRLQHPLGVAWDEVQRLLYLADTYNGSIKVLDPATRRVITWAASAADGSRLDEPGGVAIAGDRLYVADTNNHRILTARTRDPALEAVVLDGA
ncbi:MAG: alkyl hydroperoxide reductase [Longimicrobiales bacterium]